MLTEEFTDLFEDAVLQATKATSNERREYIASLLKNGITDEVLEGTGKKKLLRFLGDLNDTEIILLQYYSLYSTEQHAFIEEHTPLFTPIIRAMQSPQENFDKGAMRDSYTNKLTDLGMIRQQYRKPKKGEIPEFDEKTGRLKSSDYQITDLGRLLLRYIDLDSTTSS